MLAGVRTALLAAAQLFPQTYEITTDAGSFQAVPTAMGANQGPYYPTLVDMRAEAAFPADWACYYSTDHATSGFGGIYLSVCQGDPLTPANWKDYDAALAAGWFASVATKPAANPIIGASTTQNPAGFTQIETPHVRKVGATWVLTCHPNNVTGYRYTQATVRATSTDGINWLLPASKSTILLNDPEDNTGPPSVLGDGHTGYFRWAPNPFTALINPSTGNPWAYVGYSLAGGTDKYCQAQWGSDDPAAGAWTLLSGLHPHGGRLSDTPGLSTMRWDWNAISPESIRARGDGTFVALGSVAQLASGSATRNGAIVEVILDSLGRRVLSVPKIVRLAAGAEQEISLPSVARDGNRFIMVYNASTAADVNSLKIAAGPWREPSQVAYSRFSPDIDSGTTERYSLVNVASPPAGLVEFFTGVPVATRGAATDYGSQYSPRGGAALTSEAGIFHSAGFVPQDVLFAEWLIENNLEESATQAQRDWYLGFASQKSIAMASQTNAIFLANGTAAGGAAANILYNRVRQAGVQTSEVASVSYYGMGHNTTSYKHNRTLGLRWLPQVNRLFLIGEGGNELEEITLPTVDKTVRLYPFVSMRANSTTVNAFERIKGLQFKSKAA